MSTKLKQEKKTQDPDSLQGQYAGFISRFLAVIIDIVLVVLVVTLTGATTTLLLNFFGLGDLMTQIENSTAMEGSIMRFIVAAWGVGLVAFLYFVLAWTLTSGKSVGKGLFGVRIVPMSGEKITLAWAIWRYIGFWISVLAFGLGIFWILISDQRQGWHDMMAKTCVIYDWPAREHPDAVQNLQNSWKNLKHTRRRLREKRSKGNRDLSSDN